MKKLLILVMLIVLLLTLTGCLQLVRGIVVKKEYDDPDLTFIYTGKVMIPIRTSEQFILHVRGTNEKGKVIEETWNVPKRVYDAYHIGDFIVRPTE